MKNDNLKSFITLVFICAAVAALMGTVNRFTSPVIEQNEKEKVIQSLLVVMPKGVDFQEMECSGLPSSVKQVYKEKNGGYVFRIETTGYSAGLTVMCGVDSEGNVSGAECISGSETLGAEETYGDMFAGVNKDTVNGVDIVSGATLTTKAYKNAVSDALYSFEILTERGRDNE